MGIYLNPGDELFWQAVHSEIYVDKTGLLNYTNKVLRTSKKYLCVSRPRRFGKSMAANMIAAYYDRTVDASSTFAGLDITQSSYFEAYRNKYDVIQLNMQNFSPYATLTFFLLLRQKDSFHIFQHSGKVEQLPENIPPLFDSCRSYNALLPWSSMLSPDFPCMIDSPKRT